MLRRYQWWSSLLLNLNAIHTRSNWLCWKSQEKFQVESCLCKTIGCSCVILLTTYPAKKKKTMFKVSNRNTRKRCLEFGPFGGGWVKELETFIKHLFWCKLSKKMYCQVFCYFCLSVIKMIQAITEETK